MQLAYLFITCLFITTISDGIKYSSSVEHWQMCLLRVWHDMHQTITDSVTDECCWSTHLQACVSVMGTIVN